jgi:hypothetical protein
MLMNILSWVKEAIFPICSPGDILCQWTNGRLYLPTQVSSTIAMASNYVSATGVIAASIVLTGMAAIGAYRHYYPSANKKSSPSVQQVLTGFAEQVTSLIGFALVDGLRPIINVVPYFLSRYGFRIFINPEVAPKEEKFTDFSISRLKDINIGVLVALFHNGIKPLMPFNGLLSTTLVSTISNVFGGLLYRFEGALAAKKTDKIISETFNKDKVLKDTLDSAALFFAINASLRILSDYVIDKDDDPLKSSYTAYMLSGIAGELIFHYGKELVSQYYLTHDTPPSTQVSKKRT